MVRLVILATAFAACSGNPTPSEPTSSAPPPEPEASAAAPPQELPRLRSGRIEPVAGKALKAQVLRTSIDGDFEHILLEVKRDTKSPPIHTRAERTDNLEAISQPGSLAATVEWHEIRSEDLSKGRDGVAMVVRRPRGQRGRALKLTLVTPWRHKAAIVHPLSVGDFPKPSRKSLAALWKRAYSIKLSGQAGGWSRSGRESHPWRAYFSAYLSTSSGDPLENWRGNSGGLHSSMELLTGVSSIQEALQSDRGLRRSSRKKSKTVAMATLKGPPLKAHPFREMGKLLPNKGKGTAEPLARAAPADFWYLRFDDIRTMLTLLDDAEAWLTPLSQSKDRIPLDRQLAERYRQELGLRSSGLAKRLGNQVVERVAVVGSDPYFNLGTDLSLIFQVKNQAVFDSELSKQLKSYTSKLKGVKSSSLTMGKHSVSVTADASGVLRQHRVRVGDLAIVSNSPAALAHILGTLDGKRAALSDSEDLKFMLARDPEPSTGIAFLSDHFVARVVGPRQKIAESRRQRALSELLSPGYAAILYGWLYGTAPTDIKDLYRTKLLEPSELAHQSGGTILFDPEYGATSRWGSPWAMTPLIDLEPITQVETEEAAAYKEFSDSYQNYWRDFIDPVLVRFERKHQRLSASVRVLPLIESSDYDELLQMTGKGTLRPNRSRNGFEFRWALGQDASLRREIDRAAGWLGLSRAFAWLGDWVALGFHDEVELAELLAAEYDDVQRPRTESDGPAAKGKAGIITTASKLPAYLAVHVRSKTGLVALLVALRNMAQQAAPGQFTWGPHSKVGPVEIVRIAIGKDLLDEDAEFDFFYAVGRDALVLSPREDVLRRVLARLDGQKSAPAHGPQLQVSAEMEPGRALWTSALWLLEGESRRNQRGALTAAEILLMAFPDARAKPARFSHRARTLLGASPVNSAGVSVFGWGKLGAEDPHIGSFPVPGFPDLPLPGSPITKVMEALRSFDLRVAFEQEQAPKGIDAKSLRVRMDLGLKD